MAAIAASSAVYFLGITASDYFLPIWATKDLKLSAADWSYLRSLRFAGVFAGVVVLGALSDRFGQRRMTVLVILAIAAVFSAMAYSTGAALWLLMPVMGALMSTSFVNFNTLTQMVSDRRMGLANTIYRSIIAATAIVAPPVAAALAERWHGYTNVFHLCAACCVVGAAVLWFYPESQTPHPLGTLRDELRGIVTLYADALRQKRLMLFLHVVQAWGAVISSVGTFAAIRFTQDLATSDEYFALVSSVSSGTTLIATMAAGLVLDRARLRPLLVIGGVLSSLAALAMGVGGVAIVAAVAYVACQTLVSLLVIPVSMWVSREAGPGKQGSAFAVWKVMGAGYVAIAGALMAVAEPYLGMRNILIVTGAISAALSLAVLALREPEKV